MISRFWTGVSVKLSQGRDPNRRSRLFQKMAPSHPMDAPAKKRRRMDEGKVVESPKVNPLAPPLELVETILAFCGGQALARVAQCSERMRDAAEKRAAISLAAVTELRFGQRGVAKWTNGFQMLALYTDTPDLVALWTTPTPIAKYAVPRCGLLRFLSKQKTDYSRADHRAYALKTALRYGDAALVDAIVGRMSKEERLENSLPHPCEGWYSSHTTKRDLTSYLAYKRNEHSRRFRKSPRPNPIPRHLTTSLTEEWRDRNDFSVRTSNSQSDLEWPSWICGLGILEHFIKQDPLAFPGCGDPHFIAGTLGPKLLNIGNYTRLRHCFDAAGVPRHQHADFLRAQNLPADDYDSDGGPE